MSVIENVLFRLSAIGLHLVKHPATEENPRKTAAKLRNALQLNSNQKHRQGRWLNPLQEHHKALTLMNYGIYVLAFLSIPLFFVAGLVVYCNAGIYVLGAEILIKTAITLLVAIFCFACVLSSKTFFSRNEVDKYNVMSADERKRYIPPASMNWRSHNSATSLLLFLGMMYPIWFLT